jgi:cytochrome c oxidase cbb3-type subunit 3
MSVTTAAPDAVPAPEEATNAPPLLDHSYDGIREYDNPLPGWWSLIFVASIVFAAMYGFYFHIANWGESTDERYRAQLAEFEGKKEMRDRAEAVNVNEPALARNALDSKLVEHGAAVFAVKCAPCHTADGRGEIGPNLTDSFQLHGSNRIEIFRTIHDGVPGTAMIAWGDQLPATDVLDVAAFVTTLRGKNIIGKAPQGEPVGAFAP